MSIFCKPDLDMEVADISLFVCRWPVVYQDASDDGSTKLLLCSNTPTCLPSHQRPATSSPLLAKAIMFQNPRPASTFRETPGWNIQGSKSSFTLKVPPIGSATSSNSTSISPRRSRPSPSTNSSNSTSASLGGLEQAVISFQSFVKRTPSVSPSPNKPLPPTPLPTKRSEGSLIDAYYRRQSTISSTYSRTPSYASTGQQSPWKIQLPRPDSPPLLQPIAYSVSSPNLKQKLEKEDLTGQDEEPRAFAHLVDTPSTLSICTMDSSPKSRRSTILPTIIMDAVHSKPQMVSLEQAKQAMDAPGAVRMLPEELRAMRRVKSQGRLDSIDIFGAGQKAPLPPTRPIWRDSQGRARTVSYETQPDLKGPVLKSFHVGTGPPREMKPYVPDRPDRPDGNEGVDEPRGRTMQRPSSQSQNSQQKNGPPPAKHGGDDFAREYSSLLNQQPRVASSSPGYTSDDSIKTHMKLVPQPLFRGKGAPQSRKGSGASGFSLYPFNIHRRGRSVSTRSSGTGFNLRLSLSDGDGRSGSSRNSSIGMITISPPLDVDVKRGKLPPIDTSAPLRPKHKREKSASHFYPHVMHRKVSKAGKGKQRAPSAIETPHAPGKPLLTASVIAAQLKTPESTPDTSPLANVSLKIAPASTRKPSDAGSESSKRRLYQRIVRAGRRGSSQKDCSAERADSNTPTNASPSSPHLLPSAIKTTAVYLGWSDTAKRNFDEAKSPTSSTRPRLEHIVLPAKPLDDSKAGLNAEPESPSIGKRVNIFGNVLDSWRENKANKKREDLKKLIKVVPADAEGPARKSLRRSYTEGTVGTVVEKRRMSTDGWL